MVIKYVGRDCELSTSGVGADGRNTASWNVARAILEQIRPAFHTWGGDVWPGDGSRWGNHSQASSYSMDCLRNWPSNGQCYYSDMGHVEVCTAPTPRPKHFAAQCISTLLAAEAARERAEAKADPLARYSLSAANADIRDPAVSWGTHLNVSVSRSLWEDLCVHHRHPAILGFVTSALAATTAFFGTGYLLPIKDGSTIFSLSGRAHHLSMIKTLSTTEAFRRGLLNTRREPHADHQDRLHLIGFDYAIVSAALLCTLVQCVLAAAEEGYCGLNLYDPIQALRTWSWNLDTRTGCLAAEATMVDGRRLSLPAYVRELAATLLEMCQRGLITDEAAPDATELLPKIVELTHYAGEGSVPRCAKHLDWAAKLMCLLGADLPWGGPAARFADHDFANTNPERGAFWRLWAEGLVDPLVTMDDAQACLVEGPAETRAWGRGEIIRKFVADISHVGWDHVELYRDRDRWRPRLRIEMPQLDSLNRQSLGTIVQRAWTVADLGALIEQHVQGAARQSDPMADVASQLAVPVTDTDGKPYR